MPKTPNKTFCIMPFVHANIRTNGNIHLCCNSIETSAHNIKTSSIKDWWTSIEDVRKNMLAGVPVDACVACYDQENHGLNSLRQSNNKKFKIISESYASDIVEYLYSNLSCPIDYELQITNICNLKCLMCNETESSSLLTENKILKISKFDQRQFEWKQEEINTVLSLFQNPNTKSISLRGGEPLLIPQIKRTILESIRLKRAQQIDLQIVTNCTNFDNEWVELLNNFKSVRVVCSVDAVGDRYEYIRYGASWEQVTNNIKLIQSIKNVSITINVVVQNINLLGLPELIEWAQSLNLYVVLSRLQYPKFLSPDVAPLKIKQLAIDNLEKITYNKVENLLEVLNYLKNSKDIDSNLWEEFKRIISLKDNYRKVDITVSLPEFKECLNNQTKH